MRELKYEPATGNVCLEIPEELRKFWNAKDNYSTQAGVYIPEQAVERLAKEYLSKTLFYEILKVGQGITEYKVGDKVLLYGKPNKITMKDSADDFLQCSLGDIEGKLVE